MKRHVLKDIILALLPTGLFLAYASFCQSLRISAAVSYNYLPLSLFILAAPVAAGAILFAAMCYAWKNRASTVFIALWCGAFILNIFFSLCIADVIRSIGTLSLGRSILHGVTGGMELAGIVGGTYTVMFWVSLISFIKSKI